MKREFLDYIEDIVNAAARLQEFTRNMTYNEFVKDDKTVYAVTRAIEIIGEAVKKIPSSVKKRYPQIPWKEIAGMRDKLIHEYFGVNLRTVWETVKKDIPLLKSAFDKVKKDYRE